MAQKIVTGSKIPDFILPDQDGILCDMSKYRGISAIVIFFYPKDNSPVCTQEACSFRDSHQDFKDAGAMVFGINSGSIESHKKFQSDHNLNFRLLSDKGGKVRKMFGVPRKMLLPGRVTYVVDKTGTVVYMYDSMSKGKEHVEEALKIVKSLNGNK